MATIRLTLLAVLLVAGGGAGGGTSGPSAPSAPTVAGPPQTYLYVRGTDGLGVFRVGTDGMLTRVPASNLGITGALTFHPDGRYAIATQGLIANLYTVEADGTLKGPVQSVDASQLLPTEAAGGDLFTSWNPQGTLLALYGSASPSRTGPSMALVFSFANGTLTNVPGSPVPSGIQALWAVQSRDGLLYLTCIPTAGAAATQILAYRVTAGSVTPTQSVAGGNAQKLEILESESVLVGDGGAFERNPDGTLGAFRSFTRGTARQSPRYQNNSSAYYKLNDHSLLTQSFDLITNRSVFFVEVWNRGGGFSALGPLTDIGDRWIPGVAAARRVAFSYSFGATTIAWHMDDAGAVTATNLGMPLGGDPLVATEPSGEFTYFAVRGSAISAVRISPGQAPQAFAPLPPAPSFTVAAGRNRLEINVR